jgi:PAS domain S-box-containing protein
LGLEKNTLAREKTRDEAILAGIGDGVFVLDIEERIILFNPIAEKISGFSAKEALGKKYTDVLKFIFEKDNSVNDKFVKEAMAKGKIVQMANYTLLIKKDGTKVPVADSAAPIKDANSKVFGCVVVFRDVTKERGVDKAKTEFVSLASHQLRTPLSAINWYTELLIAGDAGKISPRQKEYLKEVYHSNQRMVDLVNTLLNVSRLEMGTFIIEPKELSLVETADSVLKELEVQIRQKQQKITKVYDKKLPAKYSADAKLLRMIFQNLLSNAVKYTPKKGNIDLSISMDKSKIKLIVADSGLGIPKAEQTRIFEKLFRADNARVADTEGTGLGLYIVKNIINVIGGQISFQSQENKGTVFLVELPSAWIKKEGSKKLG